MRSARSVLGVKLALLEFPNAALVISKEVMGSHPPTPVWARALCALATMTIVTQGPITLARSLLLLFSLSSSAQTTSAIAPATIGQFSTCEAVSDRGVSVFTAVVRRVLTVCIGKVHTYPNCQFPAITVRPITETGAPEP